MPADHEDVDRLAPGEVSHSPKHGGRAMEAPVLTFDLRTEKEQLRQQPHYQTGDLGGRTLIKQPGLRIVLMALRAGGRMREHQASGPISIQAIEGSLRVHFPAESADLTAGQLMALEPGIQHDIEAIDDCFFLLTIGRTTYEHVSDLHEPGG